MSETIKKTVNQFVKKHHITTVSYSVLRDIIKTIGFTIIEFNAIFNHKDVETIIQNLNLDEGTLRSRGFTYTDKNYRLIFINEDLNDDEKMYVLSHELGHIVCGHYTTAPIIGRDLLRETSITNLSVYM